MEAQVDNEKIVKIVNPERVQRILTRVFNAHFEVLIRAVRNPNLAVRGKAYLYDEKAASPQLVISDISEQGHRYLSQTEELRVEFVGMSTQIVFFTNRLGSNTRTISLTPPKELISFDRRENARVVVGAKKACFIQLSVWNPQDTELTAPPLVPLYENLRSFILLADMSEGGVCGFTRFPGVIDAIDRGVRDENALLLLPMQEPLKIPIEIRWARRVKDSKKIDNETRHQRLFRIGIQFATLEENQRLIIKQYMQQLSVSEAI